MSNITRVVIIIVAILVIWGIMLLGYRAILESVSKKREALTTESPQTYPASARAFSVETGTPTETRAASPGATVVSPKVADMFPQIAETARKQTCISNLRIINMTKDTWYVDTGASSKTPSWSDLVPSYMQAKPACPSGGSYRLNSVGVKPTCSKPEHEL